MDFAIEAEHGAADLAHAAELLLCEVEIVVVMSAGRVSSLHEVEEVGDGVEGVVDFVGDGGGEAAGDGEFFGGEQSVLGLAFAGDVAEDHDDAGECAGAVADGSAAVVDVDFGAVAADEDGVVGEADDALEALDFGDGGFDELAGGFVDDVEDLFEGPVEGFGLRPAGELLGDGVEQFDAAFGVADDDAVADGGERGAEALFGLEGGLGVAAEAVEGALVGVRNAMQAADGEDADEDAGAEGEDDEGDDRVWFACLQRSTSCGADCLLAVEDVCRCGRGGRPSGALPRRLSGNVAGVAAGGDLGDEGLGVADAPGLLQLAGWRRPVRSLSCCSRRFWRSSVDGVGERYFGARCRAGGNCGSEVI